MLWGAFSRGDQDEVDSLLGYIGGGWGTGRSLGRFAPSLENDPALQIWWGKCERLGASPAAAAVLVRMNGEINVRDIIPTIRVSTLVIHRTRDQVIPVKAAPTLARHIPGTRYVELPGPIISSSSATTPIRALMRFLTGSHAPVARPSMRGFEGGGNGVGLKGPAFRDRDDSMSGDQC